MSILEDSSHCLQFTFGQVIYDSPIICFSGKHSATRQLMHEYCSYTFTAVYSRVLICVGRIVVLAQGFK